VRTRDALERVMDLGVTRGMTRGGECLVAVVLNAVFAFIFLLVDVGSGRGRLVGCRATS